MSSVVGVARRMKFSPLATAGQAQLLVGLRRHVDDNEAVDAGGDSIIEEFGDRILVDRIEVAHEDDGRGVVSLAEIADEVERLAHRLPALQRPLGRHLDGGTVGHRVGEGHAQLDDIGAGGGKGREDHLRGLVVGIARRDEGHEGRTLLGRKLGEAGIDAGGHGRGVRVGFERRRMGGGGGQGWEVRL